MQHIIETMTPVTQNGEGELDFRSGNLTKAYETNDSDISRTLCNILFYNYDIILVMLLTFRKEINTARSGT